MIYIANAFSIQMLDVEHLDTMVKFLTMTIADVNSYLKNNDFTSAIGHDDTANVVSSILGREIPMNRINVHLTKNDILIVAQFMGGRLPEGATTLPEGIEIKFIGVSISDIY